MTGEYYLQQMQEEGLLERVLDFTRFAPTVFRGPRPS